jgi:hypothetical protein
VLLDLAMLGLAVLLAAAALLYVSGLRKLP